MSHLADELYAHLLDRFPADRDYPRGNLYAEGMPPLVASLLGRTLDRWLEHEIDGLESRWFDFDDPAVRAARSEFVVALGRTARVPRGAWAETLRYAVGLVVRHLSMPARALTDATFEGEPDALPTETVRARLHTFDAYGYLPEIADAYLAQKEPETVDPDTLHSLLVRIDRRVTGDYDIADWLRLLGPLFKLARYIPDLRGIEASALAHFFEGKGLDDVADELRDREEAVIDEAALREILAAHRPEKEAPEVVEGEDDAADDSPVAAEVGKASAEDEGDPAPKVDTHASGEQKDDEADEAEMIEEDEFDYLSNPEPVIIPNEPEIEDEDVQPLWKRFAQEQTGPTIETSIPHPSAEIGELESETSSDADDDDTPLWKRVITRFRGADDEPADPDRPRDPLEQLEVRVLGRSSARLRSRYLRDLFDDDRASYHDVLEKLEQTNSWTDASHVIAREVFRKFQVDIYSDTAVDFTDSVQKQLDR